MQVVCQPLPLLRTMAHSMHRGHTDFGAAYRPELALCFTVTRPAFRNRCSATLGREVV